MALEEQKHTSLSYRFDKMTIHVESANSGVIIRNIGTIVGKKDSLLVYVRNYEKHAGYILKQAKARGKRMERTSLEVHECALAPERVPDQHRAEHPELGEGSQRHRIRIQNVSFVWRVNKGWSSQITAKLDLP